MGKMDDLIKYLEENEWYDNLDDSGKRQLRRWFRELDANIRTRRQLAHSDPVANLHELFVN